MTVSVLEDGVYSLLVTGNAAGVGTRVFPSKAKQGAMRPYIVQHRVWTGYADHMTGQSGIGFALLRLRIWADTYGELRAVTEAVRGLMQSQGPVKWAGVHVGSSELKDDGELQINPAHGDQGEFGWFMDFEIAHEVTT
jgi:hypothetical protein